MISGQEKPSYSKNIYIRIYFSLISRKCMEVQSCDLLDVRLSLAT